MRIDSKPLLCLRAWFIVACVIAWNVGCLVGWNAEGWKNRHPYGLAKWVIFATTATAASVALLIVVVPKLREWVTEPSRRERYSPEPFTFIAFVTGLLALVTLWQP